MTKAEMMKALERLQDDEEILVFDKNFGRREIHTVELDRASFSDRADHKLELVIYVDWGDD